MTAMIPAQLVTGADKCHVLFVFCPPLQADLLAQLRRQGLSAFENGALQGTVNSSTGVATSVSLPQRVVEEIRAVLSCSGTVGDSRADSFVTVPALMSMGDVEMHRDHWGGRRSSQVHGHTVLVWLQGDGSRLILQSTDEHHVVEALPGRLVAFSNLVYSHSIRQGIPGAARAMIGPMAWHRSGALESLVETVQPYL